MPCAKWTFNKEVAVCFEDMLTRSIPQYDVMRKAVLDVASYKIDDVLKNNLKFSILDIGCSDGLQLLDFVNKYGNNGAYTGIDVSEDMLDIAKTRFNEYLLDKTVCIKNMDLKTSFPENTFDVITSILCIQFTPIDYRKAILSNIYNGLEKNGMFIMVEKVIGETALINKIMVDNYYSLKRENGYSQEAIDRKKLSLEGVLVPCTNNWNVELLKETGFKQVDMFWRWMNFVGYIAIK